MLNFKYVGFFHFVKGKKYKICLKDTVIFSVFKHYNSFMSTAYFYDITIVNYSCRYQYYELDSQKEKIQNAMESRALFMILKNIDEYFINNSF
jgi:hypothetical protein